MTDNPIPILSDAEEAFLRVYSKCGPAFSLSAVRRLGLEGDYRRARRAGLFEDAGIESSVRGEDLANSGPGRKRLAKLRGEPE